MIYNWNSISEGVLQFNPLTVKDFAELDKLGIGLKNEVTYYAVSVSSEQLVDESNHHVYPSANDVFIQAEKSYGLVAVIASKKIDTRWEFSLIVNELKKTVFGATKTYARPVE